MDGRWWFVGEFVCVVKCESLCVGEGPGRLSGREMKGRDHTTYHKKPERTFMG